MADTPRHPTFLFIGAPKSGSTWIYEALHDHPDVFIPPVRNVSFFDKHYARGSDWYLRHFEKAASALAVGETSHDYYLSEDAARRIRADLPDVRLICCLREPGDFAVSLLRWWHAHTRQFGSTFGEMAESPFLMHHLSYRKNLDVYFNLFSRDQIRIFFHEELTANPQEFVRGLYDFIGVDPGYQPANLSRKSNPTRAPRNRIFLISVCAVAQAIRRAGGDRLVDAIRWTPSFDRFLYGIFYQSHARGEDSSTQIELEEIAKKVRRRTAGDLAALEALIGQPLPAKWLSAAHDLG